MIDRHSLRYFTAIVDTGNFSRAAELCRVAQPTVSAAIARLEDEIGQTLFVRNNRRVEVTEAGARLLPYARRIEHEFEEASRAIREDREVLHIRLGVATTIPVHTITRLAGAALANPAIRLEVIERRPGELLSLFDRGRVDLVLGPLDGTAGRRTIELLREPYVLVMSERHRLAAAPSVTCEDLAGEPMLARRHCEVLARVSQFFTARGVRPFFPVKSLHEERIAAYVVAGMGVTVMPASLMTPGMVAVPLEEFDLARTVGVVAESGSDSPVMASGILDHIASAFEI